MMRILAGLAVVCVLSIVPMNGQDESGPGDVLAAAKTALQKGDFSKAAKMFQSVVDLNPASPEAHAGLGTALLQLLEADRVRAAGESDTVERAEDHFREAAQLAPSDPAPLLELAELERFVAEISSDPGERSPRFRNAREAIQQAIDLQPGKPELYLRLANIERDEFGPVLDDVKGRYRNGAGPIPDPELRKHLQEEYGELVDNAIRHAKSAADMTNNPQRADLLLSRLFRQRALLRETHELYALDMRTGADYERQFLATGGHVGTGSAREQ